MINEDTRDSIDRLVTKVGSKENGRFVKEAFHDLSKIALENNLNSGDWKLFNRSIKEFRRSFEVFSKYRKTRKVCVFGSARLPEDHPEFILAENFSKQIADNDFMVITGAGGGIMAAGNKGATAEKSFGVNIELPFEQYPNEYIIDDPKLISYRYFFVRKLFFVKESDATVLCPGGFGTLDEGYEVLTLLQTGKSVPRPVILLAEKDNDYWHQWIQFFHDVMLPGGYISPDDMALFKIVHTAEEAVKEITTFYSRYHSLRYVGKETVLRLNTMISDDQIAQANELFSDIIEEGTIRSVEPYDDEVRTRDFLKKPRLSFRFNKLNFGRLMELIHFINSCE